VPRFLQLSAIPLALKNEKLLKTQLIQFSLISAARHPASAHRMAVGQGGRSQKSLPGFRADAQLGDELSRHSANREGLARWMKKANGSGIYGMNRFVRKLKHDLAAVKNALRESWSNGPVEGHINRLKTLKRQMYGRAGFELLRALLLPMARGSPVHRN
jgi:hypothetical protein